MKTGQRTQSLPAFIAFTKTSAIAAIGAWLVTSVSSLALAQQVGVGGGAGVPAFAPGMIDRKRAVARLSVRIQASFHLSSIAEKWFHGIPPE